MKRVFLIILSVVMSLSFSAFFLSGCGKEESNVCTISFETYGGTAIEAITANKGEKISEPNKPNKEGLIFRGWYIDEEFTETWKFHIDVVEKDTTLYAKFEKQYEVEFFVDGESRKVNKVWENGLVKKPGDGIVAGHRVEKWYSDEQCTKEYNFDTPVTSDIKIYGKSVGISAWNFDKDTEGFVAANGTVTQANGAITYNGEDMNTAYLANFNVDINAEDYKYINFTYINSTDNFNLVFFFKRMGDDNFETSCLFERTVMKRHNKEFETYTLDLSSNENWAGKIIAFRASIQGPTPGSVTFDKIWFSKERVADPVVDWTFDNGTDSFKAVGGKLTHKDGAITYTGNDMSKAHIMIESAEVDASRYDTLNISYRNDSNNKVIAFFFRKMGTSKFDPACLITKPEAQTNNGEFVTYSIKVSDNPNWKGLINGIHVGIQGNNPGSVTFDRIWFS